MLNFIKVLIWPFLFFIGQIFICGLFMKIYLLQNPGADNSSVVQFINNQALFIDCIVFIPIFYSVYKKYRITKNSYSTKEILIISLLSFLISSSLNFIIITFKSYFDIDMVSSITLRIIITTGIIGPIIEELLFRGIVYGKMLNFFKEKSAFYLSILVFAFFHTGGISQILFALITGCYFTYLYRKYGNIKLSMLAHIIINVTSILVSPFILSLF